MTGSGETPWEVRQATGADDERVRRMIAASTRVVLHFRDGDLAKHLEREPFLIAEQGRSLRGFLAWSVRRGGGSHAALSAAGLADGTDAGEWIEHLLPASVARLEERSIRGLSYTGSATWLSEELLRHGFRLLDHVLAYEKRDLAVPRPGNETVTVRPVEPADFAALVALDAESFHPRWQNSPESLRQWTEMVPYFVVAILGDRPVGYCYCSLQEAGHGHLIRVAVDPKWQGHGVGTRLLAEAVRFFHEEGVRRITLNTQAENKQSQWLYRSFGFRLVGQEAVALWRDLGSAAG